uniref:Protein SCAF8-like n=1 Tax=Sinocyclocheilus anshuiensis TaxID=1608454 RepID=A0A671RIL7_9TELE
IYTMEAVKAFNGELYSLNEYKPPISKAKMTQITKLAIKTIKFYKHVVQSVEKFIQKCKPEYKVPGLYVIDSIVRQSRHQFGQEKDVFAPRFSKNIITTFQNLYRCPADDKSKIVRVLNLWQKNSVFKSDIIQPLLDMAAGLPPPSVTPVSASSAVPVNSTTPGTPATPATPANIVQSLPDWASQISNTDTVAAVAQILQSPQGQQLQQLVQSLQMQQQKPQPSLLQALDAGLVVQLQALTAQLTAAAAANTLNPLEQRVSSFNKKLLGQFDFRNESEHSEDSKKDATPSQLPVVPESINSSIFHQLAEHLQQQNLEQFQKQLMEHQHHQQKVHRTVIFLFVCWCSNVTKWFLSYFHFSSAGKEPLYLPRSPKRRRSRSRSGSRKRKHRKRSRSRSRDRKRKSSRSYSSERRAREREKERQKKGLPPIRSRVLSVCSTTLWVGQVDKKATQQDLTNLFEEFGQIESINMIPPRGCAYICMVHRQDAYRALQKLSTGSYKIGSKVIKIAWALNKGVKQEYKQFWDVDLGVTYIPWEKVKLDDLDDFAEGGMIDQETVNNEWESQRNTETAKETQNQAVTAETSTASSTPSEAFTQPVTMMPMQIPVAQTVPAVGLVPPSFPVTIAMPPPGFGPPPPFLRAGFNASQPPPGTWFQPEHLTINLAKADNETPPRSDVGAQQEGDQDYRFPPPEKQSTGLLKTPPLEMRTEPVPARPPLLERPPRTVMQAEGRRENMSGGFRAESRWGPPRGDFDERDMRGMSAGPPKGFQEERSNPNFQNRFEGRSGSSSGPAWNRGTGPSFNANMHQDYNDCRRPWERQKDRDDRDMDFRGEMNGNRQRERERDRNRDRERGRERNRERDREWERERDRERENEKDKERERKSAKKVCTIK